LPLLFVSTPHGEQRVFLVEDHAKQEQRIYELHDSRGNAVPLLGSEMASLVAWWSAEKGRPVKAPLG
jgi:hypothetical protein